MEVNVQERTGTAAVRPRPEAGNTPPPPGERSRFTCLDYHVLGVCKKGDRCPWKASHGFLRDRAFADLMEWVRKVNNEPVVPDGFPPSSSGREAGKGWS